MKKQTIFLPFLGCLLTVSVCQAIDLKQAKLTQVVNDVQIISAADQKQKAATVNEVFTMPDILRTGTASRAELVAQDETITRVGANTIFSFDPANRTIDLKQGSLLFHSPHGKGGGTIRTGSATASVLGTTLIVSTTPKGGMKVINLEGKVEVKFLNGLKQKLESGQMTFVLPGGNQLAPVIIFRLDELTRHSQLVKGFNQPLASLPLIQNQMDKQAKLIRSGKATDTGLYAGNDADSDKVEVVDSDTIHRSPLHAAKKADATINQSSLLDGSIPSPPYHVFTDTPFLLTGMPFFQDKLFTGFLARNIYINTVGESSPLVVDLSPYTSLASFDFVAVKNLAFGGSTTFAGLSDGNLSLYAGRQLSFSPGITVRADVQNLLFSAPTTLSLNEVSLLNLSGNLALDSWNEVSFENGSLVQAAGMFTVNAGNDIYADCSHFIADTLTLNALTGSGTVSLYHSVFDVAHALDIASAGDCTLSGSTINSGCLTINSGAGVSFENGSLIQADGHFTVNADQNISADCSHLVASSLSLNTSGSGTVYINHSVLDAPVCLNIASAGDCTVTGSTINSDADSGSVTLGSSSGSTTITDTSIRTHYLTVNSGDGILLDAAGKTLAATGAGATASFTAPNLITVNNADFSSFPTVNMAAHTINLSDVNLGAGAVTLRSFLGALNVGSSQSGYVNFIQNVVYNSGPAQNFVNNGGGITVTTLP